MNDLDKIIKGGDIPSGDYSEFELDGTLVSKGDATVFDDLNFSPDSSGGNPTTLPDYVIIDNVIYSEFTSSNNQLCGSGEEVPHAYKLGGLISNHMHGFLKSGESAGTTGVEFTIYYSLRETDGTLTTGSDVFTATSAELAANPVKFNFYGATPYSANTVGAQLHLTLVRTGGDAGDVVVTTYGCHYEIDMLGSREILVK